MIALISIKILFSSEVNEVNEVALFVQLALSLASQQGSWSVFRSSYPTFPPTATKIRPDPPTLVKLGLSGFWGWLAVFLNFRFDSSWLSDCLDKMSIETLYYKPKMQQSGWNAHQTKFANRFKIGIVGTKISTQNTIQSKIQSIRKADRGNQQWVEQTIKILV